MTRRSFISDMLKVGIATTFLPGAGRIWKPTYTPVRFFFPEPVRLEVMATYQPDALNLQEMFKTLYEIKRRRKEMGNENVIERFVDRKFFEANCPKVEFSTEHIPTEGELKGVYQRMIEL